MFDDRLEANFKKVLDACYKVHKALGPGLLESAYEICLAHELHNMGLSVKTQVSLPLIYEGVKLDAGYKIDLLVEDSIIIELKVVDDLSPVHLAQILTYLKLSGNRLGLLANFNVKLMKHGLRRVVL